MGAKTKRELISSIAAKLGHTQALTREVIQALMDEITEELAKGNRLELRQFGVFEVKKKKARIARNPRTGEAVALAPRAVVKFSPGTRMAEEVLKLSKEDKTAQ